MPFSKFRSAATEKKNAPSNDRHDLLMSKEMVASLIPIRIFNAKFELYKSIFCPILSNCFFSYTLVILSASLPTPSMSSSFAPSKPKTSLLKYLISGINSQSSHQLPYYFLLRTPQHTSTIAVQRLNISKLPQGEAVIEVVGYCSVR